MNHKPLNPDQLQRLHGLPLHAVDEQEAHALWQQECEQAGDSSGEVADSNDADALSIDEAIEQVRQADLEVSSRLHDVSVPVGLAERLKQLAAAQLDQAQHELNAAQPSLEVAGQGSSEANADPVLSSDAVASSIGEHSAEVQPRSASDADRGVAKSNRRRWIGFVAASVMVGIGLVGAGYAVVVMNRPTPPIGRDRVAQDAMAWKRQIDQLGWQGMVTEDEPLLRRYPINPEVSFNPRQYSRFSTAYDIETVVYNLTPAGQKQVLQFTARTDRQFNLERMLPLQPIYKTGSFCIGAAYHDGVLYVLFVEGDESRYRRVLRNRLPAA